MGKNESRIRHDDVKVKCEELLKSIASLRDNPCLINKNDLTLKVESARVSIFHLLDLIEIDPSVGNNLRKVIRILTVDLSTIKDYRGHFDNSFKKIIDEAFDAILEVNTLANENGSYVRTFCENVKYKFMKFCDWFSKKYISKEAINPDQRTNIIS